MSTKLKRNSVEKWFSRCFALRLLNLWLAACSLFNVSCSSFKSRPKKVAVSSSWNDVEAVAKKSELTGFTFEVISALSKHGSTDLSRAIASSETLLVNLQDGEFDLAFSTLPPSKKNQELYAFSDPIMEVGSVIVVRKDSGIKVLNALESKRVGVKLDSNDVLNLQHIQGIFYENYTDIAKAFEDLSDSKIEALVAGRLTAKAYCEGVYKGRFKVIEKPITDEAIRLIAPVQKKGLIEELNHSLKKVRDSGELKRLSDKWGL